MDTLANPPFDFTFSRMEWHTNTYYVVLRSVPDAAAQSLEIVILHPPVKKSPKKMTEEASSLELETHLHGLPHHHNDKDQAIVQHGIRFDYYGIYPCIQYPWPFHRHTTSGVVSHCQFTIYSTYYHMDDRYVVCRPQEPKMASYRPRWIRRTDSLVRNHWYSIGIIYLEA